MWSMLGDIYPPWVMTLILGAGMEHHLRVNKEGKRRRIGGQHGGRGPREEAFTPRAK